MSTLACICYITASLLFGCVVTAIRNTDAFWGIREWFAGKPREPNPYGF